MCEVTINDNNYHATNFSRQINKQLIKEGPFRAAGRITNSITFNFEQDMSFLANEKNIILSSSGSVNLENINVLEFEINDNNPRIVTFFF